jgi:hypothetical protein
MTVIAFLRSGFVVVVLACTVDTGTCGFLNSVAGDCMGRADSDAVLVEKKLKIYHERTASPVKQFVNAGKDGFPG